MRSTCRLVYCIVRRWWMLIDTHLVCNGHCQYWILDWPQWRGVCHTGRLPGGHSGPAGCSKKLNEKRQKRADFVRIATAALSSQSAPANYDKMRLLGLHGCRSIFWRVISPKGFYSERFLFRKVVFPIFFFFFSERFLLRKFEIRTFRNKTIRHSKK